jgi:hypothetical protein
MRDYVFNPRSPSDAEKLVGPRGANAPPLRKDHHPFCSVNLGQEYCDCDSGSGAQAMRPEGAQPVGPQSGGEQPHRPKPVSSQKAG